MLKPIHSVDERATSYATAANALNAFTEEMDNHTCSRSC